MRQRTSAFVSIRQHTSAYVSKHQHTSAKVKNIRGARACITSAIHASAATRCGAYTCQQRFMSACIARGSRVPRALDAKACAPSRTIVGFSVLMVCEVLSPSCMKLSPSLPPSPPPSLPAIPPLSRLIHCAPPVASSLSAHPRANFPPLSDTDEWAPVKEAKEAKGGQ